MAEAHLENQSASPKYVRRKYTSVQGAVQHLIALLHEEDAGASGFDPERAAETAGIDTSSEGYREHSSDRVRQLTLLREALRNAHDCIVTRYREGTINIHPDDLLGAWTAKRADGDSLSTIGDRLDVSKKNISVHYIDRVDGYVEAALKTKDLWRDTPNREQRSGYDAKQDYQQEDWTDGDA
jgi:hypothetical protein